MKEDKITIIITGLIIGLIVRYIGDNWPLKPATALPSPPTIPLVEPLPAMPDPSPSKENDHQELRKICRKKLLLSKEGGAGFEMQARWLNNCISGL